MSPHFPGFGIWVSALLTLSVFSFLYRDNPFFRFAESLFAGVSLGYYVGTVLNGTLMPNLFTPLQADFAQNWDLLGALAVGLLLFMRYVPGISWTSRYALAIYVAYYIGLDFTRRIHGEVLPQLSRSMLALIPFSLTSLVFVIGVYSVLVYFFFSKEQNAVTGRIARVGIWFLMISFGAAFGFTVMGRMALLMGRLNFLMFNWLFPMFGV
jgi:hypothetical protein